VSFFGIPSPPIRQCGAREKGSHSRLIKMKLLVVSTSSKSPCVAGVHQYRLVFTDTTLHTWKIFIEF
jgi:hypothetical protein